MNIKLLCLLHATYNPFKLTPYRWGVDLLDGSPVQWFDAEADQITFLQKQLNKTKGYDKDTQGID